MGAVDGEALSNTLQLERQYNWTGLLIEPGLKFFKRMKTKHRRAFLWNGCLLNTTKVTVLKPKSAHAMWVDGDQDIYCVSGE